MRNIIFEWWKHTAYYIYIWKYKEITKIICRIVYMYIICKGKTFIWNSKITSIINNHINKKGKESNWDIVKLDLISVQFHCLYRKYNSNKESL